MDTSETWTFAYSATDGKLLRKGVETSAIESMGRHALIDIAADPADSNRLLATEASTGKLLSITFSGKPEAFAGTPPMGPIDFATEGTVVGMGGTGETYVSRDNGRTWMTSRDFPGESQALVADEKWWFAATSAGIYYSADEGSTWKLYFREKP